ncbi:MAG: hypothetical protein ABR924_15180 [Terracidiphilus sp.]|jgi:hypothetical protein
MNLLHTVQEFFARLELVPAVLLFLLLAAPDATTTSKVFNVLDFGAAGDGLPWTPLPFSGPASGETAA